MNTAEKQLRARNLRLLAGLGGLFLVPLALAFWVYYGTDWRPLRTVNHGELITPARPLPAIQLRTAAGADPAAADWFNRKWTLVYIADGQCDDACHQALLVMRQTRLSLNSEMTRVERVFLATGHCCVQDFLAHEHPGLRTFDVSNGAATPLLSVFPVAEREQSVYIVDPLGNLMMKYDVRQNPKGLLQDLKKLLSLSHIG